MAARIGISKADVIDTAYELLEETQNVQAVTMTAVAGHLGIRVQSLYAHVDGTKGLQREIALRGLQKLAQCLNQAAIGVSGIDAVRSVLKAQFDFALTHPAEFAASIYPPGTDTQMLEAIEGVNYPMQKILHNAGIDDSVITHWNRLVLSTICGFSSLHQNGQLTLPVSTKDSMDYIINVLISDVEEKLVTSEMISS
jgi:AcrR family transcriptional regulator